MCYYFKLLILGGKEMTLIICPECRKEISDKAKVCVQCGFPMPEVDSNRVNVEYDNAEIVEVSNDQKGDKKVLIEQTDREKSDIKDNISFWSFSASKIILGMIVLSLCLSIYSIYASSKVSKIEDRLNTVENQIKFINQNLLLTTLGIDMTEGIVTDKVVVQKASFYVTELDTISATIDIRPQPTYTYKFLGQGDFDLTDRELRSMLEEVINEVLDYGSFDFIKTEYNLSIDKGTIYITANNYDVAEYKNGTITLSGE